MPKGAIFDIDGTLLLSNQAHAQSWVDAFALHGYSIPFERIYPLIGMGGDKVFVALGLDMKEDEGIGKEITESRGTIFMDQYVHTLQPTPGARELVLRVKEAGLTVAVATSAKESELDALLKASHVDDLFELRATSTDANESKPSPDIVKVAMDKLGLAPDEVYMVGDTPYDVEAASKIGIGTIAVRTGGHDEDLRDAVAVFDDPADIVAHFNESPLCSDRTAEPAGIGASRSQ